MIGFGARSAHQHCPLTVAQAVSFEELLDGPLVVDDGVGACPYPTGSDTRASGSQMSGNGYGSRDSV
jgi:hypothetical protein